MVIFRAKDSLTNSFLKGTRFNENITFDYRFQKPIRDRISILLELSSGKDVLHIGCCDHVPLVQNKITTDSWLHSRLSDVASSCIGIDIDKSAVQNVRNLSGLKNIFYGDVTANEKIPEIVNNKFEYVIFGEVIEHIGDPVLFLKTFLKNYRANINNVIITVPNALRGGNVRNILRSKETINSDHRFYFTPYTISKIASDAGITLVSVNMATYSPTRIIKRAILNSYPLLAENLVYIGMLDP